VNFAAMAIAVSKPVRATVATGASALTLSPASAIQLATLVSPGRDATTLRPKDPRQWSGRAGRVGRARHARAGSLAVDQDSAGATHALATARLRTRQTKILAQHLQQQTLLGRGERPRDAVDREQLIGGDGRPSTVVTERDHGIRAQPAAR
jgi:hypothetical protein